MPVRTVGEYLKRWGYTAKKPARHANDQDPEEVSEWLEETYPDIERQAEEEGAVILWTDECGVDADHHPGTGYARKGERATHGGAPQPHPPQRDLGGRQPRRVPLHDLQRHAQRRAVHRCSWRGC